MPIEINEIKIKTRLPDASGAELVHTETLIGGKPIVAYPVVSIEINLVKGEPGSAVLVIADDENFEAANDSDFDLGKRVDLAAGYDTETAALFSGTISGRSSRTDPSGRPELVIQCKSKPTTIPLPSSEAEDLELVWGSSILNFHADQTKKGVSGSVSFQGNALTVGCNIKLKGLANFVNGVKYVEAVRHVIKEGQWTTSADFSDR